MSKKLELGLPEGINLDDIDSDSSDESGDEKYIGAESTVIKHAKDSHNVIIKSVPSEAGDENDRKGNVRDVLTVDEKRDEKAMQSRLKKNEELQRRANAVMERSRQKRVQEMRKQLMHKIAEEFPNPEDRDVLRSHDVKFGPPVEKPEERKRKSTARKEEKSESEEDKEFQQEWQEVQRYMGVNAHLQGTSHGQRGPQSGLEAQMEEAIAAGNIEDAEKMSDGLATREFGQKIVEAIDAKRFLEEKKHEQLKPPKRQKLQWTFAEKQRWETKSNM